MENFTYKGTLMSGEAVSGTMAAGSQEEALAHLRKRRTQVVEIRRSTPTLSLKFGSKIALKHVSGFTRLFATTIKAGLGMVDSLDTIGQQTQNRGLRRVLAEVSKDVQSGSGLAEAMERHPQAFNRLYCAMVRAGEAGGILGEILIRLADFQEKAVKVRGKVKSALAYPAVVALVATGALIALMVFVVPTFATMLSDVGAELPKPTKVVMGLSDFMRQWILVIMGGIGVVITVGVMAHKRNEGFKSMIDGLWLRMPLFGELTRKSAVSRFSRTLGALLSGGVPIAEGLEVTAKTSGNRVLELGILGTLEAIKGGKTIASPLRETGVFPPVVVEMVRIGESTGALPDMLERVSEHYDNEVDTAVTALTGVLEPVLIVGMGILIAGVLVAMYLPMFEMITGIG